MIYYVNYGILLILKNIRRKRNGRKNLAELVKNYRLKHKIRQKDLAKQLNLSVATLSQIEQGIVREFQPKTISALNLILDSKLNMDVSKLNLIAKTRLQLGLSLRQLSNKSGIKPQVIHHLETGKTKKPHLNTLLTLALTLHLDPEEVKREFGYTYCPKKNTSGEQLIKNARIRENLSTADLANITGLTHHQLRNIETGKTKKPHLLTLEILANNLEKLNLDELKSKFGY